MSIQTVYQIMTNIEQTSGKLAKEKILKDNKDDKEFREALIFLLNPYIVTGISTKKMNKDIKITADDFLELNSLKEVMDYLKSHNSGRDANVFAIQHFIQRLATENLQTFVKKFVTKDLKLGISEKTVNKIYGKDTIPSFAVMLAEPFAKKSDKVVGKFYVTLKLDGNRCIAMNFVDGVKFFTRKGQPIEGLIELENQFKNLPKGVVYDGELLLINKDNLPSDELFRATQKVVRKDGAKKDLDFHIFDSLPTEEFIDGKSKDKYEKRREYLKNLPLHIEALTGNADITVINPNIHILPVLYEGTDKSVIPTLLEQVEADGYEGLMINTANGLYQSKRTVDLQKVKTFLSSDGVVTGVYEGTGRNEGRLGGILITYKDKSVKIGSGFTDEERELYWKKTELIIGKVGQYNYFEESSNQNGGYDLRFATWKGIREDKTSDDVNYE